MIYWRDISVFSKLGSLDSPNPSVISAYASFTLGPWMDRVSCQAQVQSSCFYLRVSLGWLLVLVQGDCCNHFLDTVAMRHHCCVMLHSFYAYAIVYIPGQYQNHIVRFWYYYSGILWFMVLLPLSCGSEQCCYFPFHWKYSLDGAVQKIPFIILVSAYQMYLFIWVARAGWFCLSGSRNSGWTRCNIYLVELSSFHLSVVLTASWLSFCVALILVLSLLLHGDNAPKEM